jgi:hypothetical protein
MALWKLKPIDLSSPDWELSTYQEEVIVRAESETRARQIAASAFVTAGKVKSGEKTIDIPWNQSILVSAAPIQDSNYQDRGNEEIVGPPEAVRYVSI